MKKKILIITLIIVYIMSGLSSVFADNSRATFSNAQEKGPHLFVKKNVESAHSDYEIPDLDFVFVVKLNGELAESVEYKVFDSDGTEIFDEIFGIQSPFKTSKNGNFTLKAGQTAKFENVGSGVGYEITEVTTYDNFIQTSPAGGVPIKGTVPNDGASEVFTNTYIPKGQGESTAIEISKNITYPTGYELPSVPAFTFTLKLSDIPYDNEEYTIIDSVTKQKIDVGWTSTSGSFTLMPNQIARFENIETNLDYEVTESSTPGWTSVGETKREGSTKAPITSEMFTNKNASFGVSKKLVDGSSSDDTFTFTLTDGMRTGIADAKYYLYTTGGVRVDNVTYTTDGKGEFTLKAGEVAIFVGIENGVTYNVAEKGRADYTQVVPAANEGYMDKIIDDSFEILPFVNEPVDITGALTVTKTVTPNHGGEMPFDNADFNFILTKKVNDSYVPVPDAIYSIKRGESVSTYKTKADGSFELKRNETALFEYLPSNETYRVEEIGLTEDYTCERTSDSGILTNSENTDLSITNKYKGKEIRLSITKVDQNGEGLYGAQFHIYTDEALVNKMNNNPLKSDSNGDIGLRGLTFTAGTYYLKEIQAPRGHQLLANPIKIVIKRFEDDLKVSINGEDGEDMGIVHVTMGEENDEVTLEVANTKGFNLPRVGGIGIWLFIAVAAIGITTLSIFIKRRKSFGGNNIS